MDRLSHWDQVYRTRSPEQVSWYQVEAHRSRALIERVAPDRSARIVDVGAGASTLVDGLLDAGYLKLTVVDLSYAALALAARRPGAAAAHVNRLNADVLSLPFTGSVFDVWHDRAFFHFLTQAEERARYVEQMRRTVAPGGHVLVATFAEDGPTRCSGLEVLRYSPSALHSEFGRDFRLLAGEREVHTTPTGSQQTFSYCLCRFEPAAH